MIKKRGRKRKREKEKKEGKKKRERKRNRERKREKEKTRKKKYGKIENTKTPCQPEDRERPCPHVCSSGQFRDPVSTQNLERRRNERNYESEIIFEELGRK